MSAGIDLRNPGKVTITGNRVFPKGRKNMDLTTEQKVDRRLGYKLALERIVSEPALLLQFAALEKCGVQEAFVALDERIRQLEQELKTT